MIRINKPAIVPGQLDRGIAATAANCAAFDAASLSFIEGLEDFDFDAAIYGHASVKRELEAAQHGKCCYCENKFGAAAPGDVEHFRPKKGVRQDKGHPVEHPGYYWLAYAWSNLYYSCENCNRSGKKSFFPLSDATKRARIHTDSLGDEQPLLVDPGGADDPRDHIHFHREVAVGISAKGRQTVKTLKLDRLALNEERLVESNRLEIMRDILNVYEAKPLPEYSDVADKARDYLENAVKPEAIFSAMAQDLLR